MASQVALGLGPAMAGRVCFSSPYLVVKKELTSASLSLCPR